MKMCIINLFIFSAASFLLGSVSAQAVPTYLVKCSVDQGINFNQSVNSVNLDRTNPSYTNLKISCDPALSQVSDRVVYCFQILRSPLDNLDYSYHHAALTGGLVPPTVLSPYVSFNFYGQNNSAGSFIKIGGPVQNGNKIFGEAVKESSGSYSFNTPIKLEIEGNSSNLNNPPQSGLYKYGQVPMLSQIFYSMKALDPGTNFNEASACGTAATITGALASTRINVNLDTKPSCSIQTTKNMNFGQYKALNKKITVTAGVNILCSPNVKYDYTIDEMAQNKSKDGVFRMRSDGVSDTIPYSITPTSGSGVGTGSLAGQNITIDGTVEPTKHSYPVGIYKDTLIVTLTQHI